MLGFEWSWALLLLPLPWLARRLLPAGERTGLAISVPLLNREGIHASAMQGSTSRTAGLLLWLFWIALLAAASRPFWIGEPVSRTVSGRDLMLAVDVSGSMSETDMSVDSRAASRLDVLKLVAGRFIERRRGDRIGLILFGTRAYNYVPLTFDLDTLKQLLLDVSAGLAGRHTAIGDAIGIAIKAMHEDQASHKVLVLVTDGSNTAGFENPLLAAAAARQQGMTIHTIGVGSDIESLSRVYGRQNIPTGVVLNESLLRGIAEISGGKYFRATDSEALERIYQSLDELEPVEYQYHSYRPRVAEHGIVAAAPATGLAAGSTAVVAAVVAVHETQPPAIDVDPAVRRAAARAHAYRRSGSWQPLAALAAGRGADAVGTRRQRSQLAQAILPDTANRERQGDRTRAVARDAGGRRQAESFHPGAGCGPRTHRQRLRR
jgi:Ca-activated chloride channel family protein